MADEYIKREAALKSVCYDCSLNENNPFCGIACADYERIKSIPAADVVPVRHGWWLKCKPYNPEFNGYECSECGAKYQGFSPDNYCPNCGAKMDVKNEP
jgi:DNA-directed RNA polymerase subunit RPC12/RpoP